jgi:hypothetical protein
MDKSHAELANARSARDGIMWESLVDVDYATGMIGYGNMMTGVVFSGVGNHGFSSLL